MGNGNRPTPEFRREAGKACFPINRMCCFLGVSQSGFFAWQERRACRQQQQDMVQADAGSPNPRPRFVWQPVASVLHQCGARMTRPTGRLYFC
jgi:hypothetical protein